MFLVFSKTKHKKKSSKCSEHKQRQIGSNILIAELLTPFIAPFQSLQCENSDFEESLYLYEIKSYPFGMIAECKYYWNHSFNALCLWLHSCVYGTFTFTFICQKKTLYCFVVALHRMKPTLQTKFCVFLCVL